MGLNWYRALTAVPASTIEELISGGLGFGVYRNLASTFMGSGVGFLQGYTRLKSFLPGLDFTTFGDIYGMVYEERKQQARIEEVGAYGTLDEADYIQRILKRGAKYRYIGEFTLFNDLTGEYEKSVKSFYSNDRLTVGEAGQMLQDSFETDVTHYTDDFLASNYVSNIRFLGVEHNEGWKY